MSYDLYMLRAIFLSLLAVYAGRGLSLCLGVVHVVYPLGGESPVKCLLLRIVKGKVLRNRYVHRTSCNAVFAGCSGNCYRTVY